MYKLILLLKCLLLFQYCLADEITSQQIFSEIQSVTAYLNNAEIQRTETIDIPTGKSEVVFENISSKILDKGLKVSISNDVKVYAVSIAKNEGEPKKSKIMLELQDSLLQIGNRQLQSKLRLATFKKELEFLVLNMKVHNNSNITFSKIDEAQKYFSKKVNGVEEKILKEEKVLEKLTARHHFFLEKNKKAGQKANETNSKVKIIVLSDKATTCSIQLRYLVSHALWKPLYAMRATEGSDIIQVDYQAQIFNNTGVDWNDKPITLAILDSSDDVVKPDLEIWALDGDDYDYSDNNNSWSRKKNKKKEKETEKDGLEYDILEIDDLSTRFELSDLHTIPSDSIPHLIDVASYEKPVEYYSLSIPKVKNGAYLIARIKDWENLGLMDGIVHLYYNNSYQGFSNLETQHINDVLDISLGRDNSYTVSRRKINSKSKKRLLGFTIEEKMTYEIMIRNNKDEKGDLQIIDQIPISTSKDVEVKITDISNATLEPLTGELKWDIRLKPNEVKKMEIKFTIKYPKGKKHKIRYNNHRYFSPRYF
ncbi:MAG: mucoidy inhibitor MuiA family protein [Chitinophagales bacterium]